MRQWNEYVYRRTGKRNSSLGRTCQDMVSTIHTEDGRIYAAISDGLGSKVFSEIASQAAVEFVLSWLKENGHSLHPGNKEDMIYNNMLPGVQNAVLEAAARSGRDISDMDCNLAFVAVCPGNPGWAIIGQLGDTAVCVVAEEQYVYTSAPGSAVATDTVFSKNVAEKLKLYHISLHEDQPYAFLLLTDGLDTYAYRKGSSWLFKKAENLINPLIEYGQQEGWERLCEQINELVEVDPYFDDDISLCVITNSDIPVTLEEDPFWLCPCGTKNSTQYTRCTQCNAQVFPIYGIDAIIARGGIFRFFHYYNHNPREWLETYPKVFAAQLAQKTEEEPKDFSKENDDNGALLPDIDYNRELYETVSDEYHTRNRGRATKVFDSFRNTSEVKFDDTTAGSQEELPKAEAEEENADPFYGGTSKDETLDDRKDSHYILPGKEEFLGLASGMEEEENYIIPMGLVEEESEEVRPGDDPHANEKDEAQDTRSIFDVYRSAILEEEEEEEDKEVIPQTTFHQEPTDNHAPTGEKKPKSKKEARKDKRENRKQNKTEKKQDYAGIPMAEKGTSPAPQKAPVYTAMPHNENYEKKERKAGRGVGKWILILLLLGGILGAAWYAIKNDDIAQLGFFKGGVDAHWLDDIDGTQYYGPTDDGIPNGEGIVCIDGEYWIGTFVNGSREGIFVVSTPDDPQGYRSVYCEADRVIARLYESPRKAYDDTAYRMVSNITYLRERPGYGEELLDREISQEETVYLLTIRETGDGLMWALVLTEDGTIGWCDMEAMEEIPTVESQIVTEQDPAERDPHEEQPSESETTQEEPSEEDPSQEDPTEEESEDEDSSESENH